MKIIATDLDRTLIPDGNEPLSKSGMKIFKKILEKKKFKLVFVTGRNKGLILEGIKKYSLPKPDFCISSVGTIIYKYSGDKLEEIPGWKKEIKRNSKNFKIKKIKSSLKKIPIKEQPKKHLNEFKQSYFVKLNKNTESVVALVREKIEKSRVSAQVVYSVDHEKRVGLIDIIPKSADKVKALKFLTKKLKVKKENVVYAGDSGNDTTSLTSGLKAVLVKNASHDIKEAIIKISEEKKIKNKVYLAKGKFRFMGKNLNGNYVSGILEGLNHFDWI